MGGGDAPARTIEATYQRPYHMHASLGTSAAVATLGADGVTTIQTHSQSVFQTGEAIAKMLGVDRAKNGGEEAGLVDEMVGERAAREAGFGGQRIKRDVGEAAFSEGRAGGGDQAFGRFGGLAGARGWRERSGHPPP